MQFIHSISWKDTDRKQQKQHIYMNLQIIGLLLASARIRTTQPTTQIQCSYCIYDDNTQIGKQIERQNLLTSNQIGSVRFSLVWRLRFLY